MGIIIYIEGSLEAKLSLNKKQRTRIEKLVDSYGDRYFLLEGELGDSIRFMYDRTEGCDPVTDYVETPLKKLLDVAKKEGFVLNGEFNITSDSCSEYDNIAIIVRNNEIVWGNSEIRNATTEELLTELAERKVLPKGFKTLNGYGINLSDGEFHTESQIGADLVLALPELENGGVILRIAEGTGDNLLKEDEKEGFVDYINYDIYNAQEAGLSEEPIDGGMLMSKEYIRDKYDSLIEAIPDVLDLAYGTTDLTYFVISGGKSWKEEAA